MSVSESIPAVNKWEYDSFIYHFPLGYLRVRLYSETEAKRKFWQKSKDYVWIELQKWLDRGWEPVDKVGASCIHIRTDKSGTENMIRVLFGLLLLFLSLLGGGAMGGWKRRAYAEPVAFRLAMRRLKGNALNPHKYTRLKAELEEAESERRELESSFAFRFGRFIRKLFDR